MSPRSLSLGTLQEVPEEDLFVFVSLSPGVFQKETQRKAKLSVIVSCVVCLLVFCMKQAPGEDLFVIHVACLLVLC